MLLIARAATADASQKRLKVLPQLTRAVSAQARARSSLSHTTGIIYTTSVSRSGVRKSGTQGQDSGVAHRDDRHRERHADLAHRNVAEAEMEHSMRNSRSVFVSASCLEGTRDVGAGDQSRTGMPLRAVVFETTASAIPPLRRLRGIIPLGGRNCQSDGEFITSLPASARRYSRRVDCA